jgi:hypothetical protein
VPVLYFSHGSYVSHNYSLLYLTANVKLVKYDDLIGISTTKIDNLKANEPTK